MKAFFLKKLLFTILLNTGGENLFPAFWRRQGLILSYHGIVPDHPMYAAYPYGNFVSSTEFHFQMTHLAKCYNPMPLREMLILLKKRQALPAKSIAITFDDGYVNNLQLAAPVLRKLNIPATFFIASGFLGEDHILPAEELKLRLYYSLEARMLFARLTGLVPPVDNEKDESIISWVSDALTYFKHLPHADTNTLINRIRKTELPAFNEYKKPFIFMNADELSRLSALGGMDVGGHTVNHVILSRVEEHEAGKEIALNQNHLQMLTGQPVDVFAYPNGQAEDFTLETVNILRKSGFTGACTEIPGFAGTGSDLYKLPRMDIGRSHERIDFRSHTSGMNYFIKHTLKKMKSSFSFASQVAE